MIRVLYSSFLDRDDSDGLTDGAAAVIKAQASCAIAPNRARWFRTSLVTSYECVRAGYASEQEYSQCVPERDTSAGHARHL